jgi:DNA mismatch endonuclease (patch repair protein)
MDKLSREARSALMSRIRGKNTQPELIVRRLVHSMGFRYRLYRSELPGTPDLVFPGRRRVVFVHGCFWHNHQGCPGVRLPKSRKASWLKKLARNSERDRRVLAALRKMGWRTLVVWECQLRGLGRLRSRVARFLDG